MLGDRTKLTLTMMEDFLDGISTGQSVIKLCEKWLIQPRQFYAWAERDALFSEKLALAYRVDVERRLETLDSIAEQDDSKVAKVKSDNIKWLASKRSREKYGDRTDIHLTQTLDISGILKAAESRVATMKPAAAAALQTHATNEIIEVNEIKNANETSKERFEDLL